MIYISCTRLPIPIDPWAWATPYELPPFDWFSCAS